MIPPSATYRLQMNKDFTFSQARALVPYLEALGISHVYLSPILKAKPGSTHGYDTVDHLTINPELGTPDDFRALAKELHARDMGIVLDIVPNHMGVGGADNLIWLDVLKHGPASRYADWFDIDWHSPRPGMDGKLLVPFLGTPYAAALAAGDLAIKADSDGVAVWAYDSEKLPLRPETTLELRRRHGSAEGAIAALTGTPGVQASWAGLDEVIAHQHWRLAYFAVAADEINYRRFFINSDLAGIRVDRPEVFDHAHQLVFSLIEEGLVQGLRVDHIDGLLDPKGYLEMLRAKVPREIYLVVEKILAPHEPLPANWPIEGTTGYEVGALLTRVLVQRDAEASLTKTYGGFTSNATPPGEEAYLCKLQVMESELTAELDALARSFAVVAWTKAETGDLTQGDLRRALRETIAQMSVYRTYADNMGLSSRDRRELARAIGRARQRRPQVQPASFDFVSALLCDNQACQYDPVLVVRAVGKFQQYTGPVMAKGLEDTALYRYNRLVGLNEVGAHPERFAVSIAAFHDSNRRRLTTHQHCMIATSTHDTKRGEDVRAIIGAISDAPELWAGAVADWRSLLSGDGADDIHPNDLYLVFQLLVGGWPLSANADDLPERLKAVLKKSLREARQRSDWGVNNTDYENAVDAFIERALANPAFLDSFHRTRLPLHEIGRRKGLAQAALKLTIPGVPDIYRGAEDWEQSFVDPDNRRPVDFAALAQRLSLPLPGRDDKLILTQSLLRLRRQNPRLFSEGSYEPFEHGEAVLGFRRKHGSAQIIVLVDLSRGHEAGFAPIGNLPTIAGSIQGPVWVSGAEP